MEKERKRWVSLRQLYLNMPFETTFEVLACVRTAAETGALEAFVFECAFGPVFEAFACVRSQWR